MCIGFNATPAREPIANRNDGAPLGKARAHLKIFLEPITQSIEAFCDLFTWMGGQFPGACVHFDAGNDTRINENFDKGCSVGLLLTNGFVVEDCAADELPQPWRGHNQFAIGASSFNSQRNSKCSEALVARRITLVHRQQALAVNKKSLHCVLQLLCIHLRNTPISNIVFRDYPRASGFRLFSQPAPRLTAQSEWA